MGNHRKIIFIFWLGALAFGCLDPYAPPSSGGNNEFLVIDANINSTENVAIVKLSKSVPLTASSLFPRETGASVFVEDENNNLLPIPEIENGVYSLSNVFDNSLKYRLNITLASGKGYVSEFIQLEKSLPIDSVTWTTGDGGLQILLNSHDFSDGTKYYRYSFQETYEYASAFFSSYNFVNGGAVYRTPEEEIHRCWSSFPSTPILLATTEGLEQNIISRQLIQQMQKSDPRLRYKYSVLVKQQALSKEAYYYLLQLRKLNESLGGLFDPIPYKLNGNVKSANDPSELVLGYFFGAETSEKRVVIKNLQLPIGYGGTPFSGCLESYIPIGELSTLEGENIILTSALSSGIIVLGYFYSYPSCVDCRLVGGTNVKPEFMK